MIPNTVYRPIFDENNPSVVVGINLVALTDIQYGEELFDDYRRHGLAPRWLLQFAKDYNLPSLNFANCNDFVV